MNILIVGLLIFLGTHSLRMVADGWRGAQIARLGENTWKAAYSAVSLLGFGLIVWGYALARQDPVVLWWAPTWTRHLAALLTLPAFVLLAAAYVPGTHIRTRIGHPMLAGVKLWALAHLIANGMLADVLLFGSFLAWSIACFAVSRRRDRLSGTRRPALGWQRDAIAVVVGVLAWFVFARHLHAWLFGIAPFG